MRSKIKGVILKTPLFKLFELSLFLGSVTFYLAAYDAADHVGQVLAAVACTISLLLLANTIPTHRDEVD